MAARRDLGRTRLERCKPRLLGLSSLQQRYPEAPGRQGAGPAADLEPLASERPGDGGARRLLAECESLDGLLCVETGHTYQGRAALERATAIYDSLIHEGPPYTLPTAADGPTEYRRGLARVIARTAVSWTRDGDTERAHIAWEQHWRVLEDLTAGPFADDADWQNLADGYSLSTWAYGSREIRDEQLSSAKRAAEIFRRLSAANPTVASYRRGLAAALARVSEININIGHIGTARSCVLEALSPPSAYSSLRATGRGWRRQ